MGSIKVTRLIALILRVQMSVMRLMREKLICVCDPCRSRLISSLKVDAIDSQERPSLPPFWCQELNSLMKS